MSSATRITTSAPDGTLVSLAQPAPEPKAKERTPPAVDPNALVKQKKEEALGALYPPFPWMASHVNEFGKLLFHVEQLPTVLREKLHPHVKALESKSTAVSPSPDPHTGMLRYKHVYKQSGANRKETLGWFSCIDFGSGSPTRIIFAEWTELCALTVAAAKLDSRMQSQKSAESWVRHMVNPPEYADEWLAEVDTSVVPVSTGHGGRKPGSRAAMFNEQTGAYVVSKPRGSLPQSMLPPKKRRRGKDKAGSDTVKKSRAGTHICRSR